MSHWTEKELALTQMDDERLKKRKKKTDPNAIGVT